MKFLFLLLSFLYAGEILAQQSQQLIIHPEEYSAVNSIKRYKKTVKNALKGKPAALTEFLVVATKINYQSASGAALFCYFRFPEVLGHYSDTQITSACKPLSTQRKKELHQFMLKKLSEYRKTYPETYKYLGEQA